MKSVHRLIYIFIFTAISGCLPDSFNKWEKEEPATFVSPSTVAIQVDGQQVRVNESSGLTPPIALTASVTVDGLDEDQKISSQIATGNIVRVAIGKDFSMTPTFIEESEGSNSYFYSIEKTNNERFNYEGYGISFNSTTGKMSGEPTSHIDELDLLYKAYHVESGSWLTIPFKMFSVTPFTEDDENKLYFPISKNEDSYYILEVEDVSNFNLCPDDKDSYTDIQDEACVTADNGVQGFVEFINTETKTLFVKIPNTLAQLLPEHQTFEDAKTLDNANDFVDTDTNIVHVTRTFKRCTLDDANDATCGEQIQPAFNFMMDTTNVESRTLEWSISPIPPGGISSDSQTLLTGAKVGFVEESTGTDSGTIVVPKSPEQLKNTEYTVTVRNLLNQTLSTKIKIGVTEAPKNLGIGNLYLLTLDSNKEFRVGNFISSDRTDSDGNSEGSRGKVLQKIGTSQLVIEVQLGDFETGDFVDHLKKFSRKRGVVQYKTLFNTILTLDDVPSDGLQTDKEIFGEYNNRIRQQISGEKGENDPSAVVKKINSEIISFTVYGGAHQFSPGLQIVQEGEDSSCLNGDGVPSTGAVGTVIAIMRNDAEIVINASTADDDTDQNLVVNVLSGTFVKNRPIQLGGSEYDCTTTSVDMIKNDPQKNNYHQVYVMVPNGYVFNMANPNELAQNIHFNSETTAQSKVYSVWSQNVRFNSVNQAGKWHIGDNISTRSHIPGVVTGVESYTEPGFKDLDGNGTEEGTTTDTGIDEENAQIVTAQFKQTGFLFSSTDRCHEVSSSSLTESDRADCRTMSTGVRNPGRGDEGDNDPEIIFAKGKVYKFENIMNMSAYDVVSIDTDGDGNTDLDAYEDNGDSKFTKSGSSDDRRDDPQIKNLQTTHHYVFYAREPVVLKSELQYGDSTVFEITPSELPEGLTFDSTSGTLSGTPILKLDKTNFTITAKNPIGSASADFSMEVKDYFKVELPLDFTEPESFKLHMSGQGNQASSCRITGEQIEGNNQYAKDVLCYLEAGEKDLFFYGLKLKYEIGPSMCEFVQFQTYTYTHPDYPYIKSGTRGRHQSGTTLSTLNTVMLNPKNSQEYVKVFRSYEGFEDCKRCYEPETGEVIDCAILEFFNTSDNPNKCDSDYERKFGLDGMNCDDGKFIDRIVSIGNDESSETADKIKDGVCGISEVAQVGSSTHSLAYPASVPSFRFGVLTENSTGSNDFDGNGKVNYVIDTGGNWGGATVYNIPTTFDRPCADSTSSSNTYSNPIVLSGNNPDSLTIRYNLTKNNSTGDGNDCTNDDLGKNVLSTPTDLSFTVTKLTGFDKGTITLRGSTYTNNIASNTMNFAFYDSNDDGKKDVLIAGNTSSSIYFPCSNTTCVDVDEDGLVDYVDLNSDGIADDIIDSSGQPGTDNWGDHTQVNGGIGRIDSKVSEIKDLSAEEASDCGGQPYNCLIGSNKLLTAPEEWRGEAQSVSSNTVYGGTNTYEYKPPMDNSGTNNKGLANYAKNNSCGISPLIINQNSVFHNPNGGNYSDSEALDAEDVSGTAGTFVDGSAGMALDIDGSPSSFATGAAPTSLFWEILTSYNNEDFYKGLGDLLKDDFDDLTEDDANGGGASGLPEDFDPSVSLPFYYKRNLDETNAESILSQANPILGLAKKKSNNTYEFVTAEDTYDNSTSKKEITYYDSGHYYLGVSSTKDIWRLPVKKFFKFNDDGATPDAFDNNEKINNLRGLTVEFFTYFGELVIRGVVIDMSVDVNPTFETLDSGSVDILVTYPQQGYLRHKELTDLFSNVNWDGLAANFDGDNDGDYSPFFLQGIGEANRVRSNILFTVDTSITLPYIVRGGAFNSGGSYKARANPFYTFSCLDANEDLKARIRIQVRDWDRDFTAGHDIDKTIPSSLMDDNSVDVWGQGFDNRFDQDSDGNHKRSHSNCLIDLPTTKYDIEPKSLNPYSKIIRPYHDLPSL